MDVAIIFGGESVRNREYQAQQPCDVLSCKSDLGYLLEIFEVQQLLVFLLLVLKVAYIVVDVVDIGDSLHLK